MRQIGFLRSRQPVGGIAGADAVELKIDVMLIRGAFDKKLHTAILIDRRAIFVVNGSEGVGHGEELDEQMLVASGDVERCDGHVGITWPIDLVDVVPWGFPLDDVDDGGGIQHFQCGMVRNSQLFHDD